MNVRIQPIIVAITSSFVFSCAGTPKQTATAKPPEITSQELNVQQDLMTFDLQLVGQVSSPVGATVEKAEWEMVVEGEVVKRGEANLNVSVPAGGTAPFNVGASGGYVKNMEELKAMSERGGSLLTALRGNLVVNQDGNTVKLPFARSREVRTPRLPTVRLQELDAARYSPEEANVVFYLGVVNNNPFPLKVNDLTYKISVQGKQIAEGTRARGDAIDAAGAGVFEVQVGVNKDTYGPDVKKLIQTLTLPYLVAGELKGELFTVPYQLNGDVKLNVSK